MKKNPRIIIIGILSALIIVVGSLYLFQDRTIDEAKALSIAYQDASIDESKVTLLSNEYTKNEGYVFEFVEGEKLYTYSISEKGKITDKNNTKRNITVDEAEEIALADAKVSIKSGDISFEQKEDIYYLTFDYNDYTYTYEINTSGKIVNKDKKEKKKLTLKEAMKLAKEDAHVSNVTFTKKEKKDNYYLLVFEDNKYSYTYEIDTNGTIQKNSYKEIEKITLNKAKQIALKDAGVSNVTYTKESSNNGYVLEFKTSTKSYHYEINTKGKITNKSSKAINTDISLAKAKSIAINDANVSSVEYTKNAKYNTYYLIEFKDSKKEYSYEIDFKGNIIKHNSEDIEETISLTKAKKIATKHAGVSNVTYTTESKTNSYYHLVFNTSSKTYTYHISFTGEILSHSSKEITKSDIISLDEAKEAALLYVGAKESQVKYTKTTLSNDVYHIHFTYKEQRYRIKVNAKNGRIIKS